MDQPLPPAPWGPLHICSTSLLRPPSLRFPILFLAFPFLSAFLFCSQTCLCFCAYVSLVTFFLMFFSNVGTAVNRDQVTDFSELAHMCEVCVSRCHFTPISPRDAELQGFSSTSYIFCMGENLLASQQLCGVWQ